MWFEFIFDALYKRRDYFLKVCFKRWAVTYKLYHFLLETLNVFGLAYQPVGLLQNLHSQFDISVR